METSITFAESFAKKLTDWLPELEGRALAISESDPFTAQTMPRLPLAIVAVVNEDLSGFPNLTTDFLVEVMLAPVKYEREDGADSPFWAYYDYTVIRDKLLAGIQGIGGIRPLQIEIEADPLAVYLSFRFRRTSKWCDTNEQAPAIPVRISAKVLPAKYFFDSQPPEKEADNA